MARETRRGRFALSSNLGAQQQSEEYKQFSSQEDPNYPEKSISNNTSHRSEDQIDEKEAKTRSFTTGAGSSEQILNLGKSLNKKDLLTPTEIATTLGTQAGEYYKNKVGTSAFIDIFLIGIAFLKDFLDFIVGVGSLGLLALFGTFLFSTFLTIMIFVIKLGKGGAISRFITRWIIISVIDVMLGSVFLFIPISGIGMMLLVRQERKKRSEEEVSH